MRSQRALSLVFTGILAAVLLSGISLACHPPTMSIRLGDEEGGSDEMDDDGTVWATLTNADPQGSPIKQCAIDWGEGAGWEYITPADLSLSHEYPAGEHTVLYLCRNKFMWATPVSDSIEVFISGVNEPPSVSISLGDESGGDDETDDDGEVWATLSHSEDVTECMITWGEEWEPVSPETMSLSHALGKGAHTVYYKCANAYGWKEESDMIEVMIPNTVPSEPEIIFPNDEGVGTTNISFTWTPGTDADGDPTHSEVHVSTVPDFSELMYYETGININLLEYADLGWSTQYYWRVRTCDAGGCSAWVSAWFKPIKDLVTVFIRLWDNPGLPTDWDNDGNVFASLANGHVDSCELDWGDGLGWWPISASVKSINHVYLENGSYTARYRCTNNAQNLTVTAEDGILVAIEPFPCHLGNSRYSIELQTSETFWDSELREIPVIKLKKGVGELPLTVTYKRYIVSCLGEALTAIKAECELSLDRSMNCSDKFHAQTEVPLIRANTPYYTELEVTVDDSLPAGGYIAHVTTEGLLGEGYYAHETEWFLLEVYEEEEETPPSGEGGGDEEPPLPAVPPEEGEPEEEEPAETHTPPEENESEAELMVVSDIQETEEGKVYSIEINNPSQEEMEVTLVIQVLDEDGEVVMEDVREVTVAPGSSAIETLPVNENSVSYGSYEFKATAYKSGKEVGSSSTEVTVSTSENLLTGEAVRSETAEIGLVLIVVPVIGILVLVKLLG